LFPNNRNAGRNAAVKCFIGVDGGAGSSVPSASSAVGESSRSHFPVMLASCSIRSHACVLSAQRQREEVTSVIVPKGCQQVLCLLHYTYSVPGGTFSCFANLRRPGLTTTHKLPRKCSLYAPYAAFCSFHCFRMFDCRIILVEQDAQTLAL
jgi:hypothetical protein